MIREICLDNIIPKGIKEFAKQALQNLADAHDTIIGAWVFQTHHTNNCRTNELKIAKGDLVFLSTKNLNLPSGRTHKLCPKFIGPYKILQTRHELSTYMLELPMALQTWQIIPVFQISLLWTHHASNNLMFLNWVQLEQYDFGMPDNQEWFMEELIGYQWTEDDNPEFEVWWSLGDTTWEPLSSCKDLEALDRYLELQGIKRPFQLPKHQR
jgi:hypothetical protein